jgi:hypothetical protein
MNASRLAVWIVGAAVSGAWLASAAGVTRPPRIVRVPPTPPDSIQLDALAAEVQTQAGRLREHLANAPAPRATARNPFSFYSAPSARRPASADVRHATTPAPIAPEMREPVIELIGIAENPGANGPVRTALITNEQEDLMMVTSGQRILSRYDVLVITAEAVDLKDIQTGATRRLILR